MKMKRTMATILLTSAIASASGCCSVSMRNYPYPEKDGPVRYVYPGASIDLEGIASPFTKQPPNDSMATQLNCLFIPFALIDLPFSFVLDTLCLTYDIYKVTAGGMTRRGVPKEENKDRQQPASPRTRCPERRGESMISSGAGIAPGEP